MVAKVITRIGARRSIFFPPPTIYHSWSCSQTFFLTATPTTWWKFAKASSDRLKAAVQAKVTSAQVRLWCSAGDVTLPHAENPYPAGTYHEPIPFAANWGTSGSEGTPSGVGQMFHLATDSPAIRGRFFINCVRIHEFDSNHTQTPLRWADSGWDEVFGAYLKEAWVYTGDGDNIICAPVVWSRSLNTFAPITAVDMVRYPAFVSAMRKDL